MRKIIAVCCASIAVLAAACSAPSPAPATAPAVATPAPGALPSALTPAAARQVFATFSAQFTAMESGYPLAQVARLTAGPERRALVFQHQIAGSGLPFIAYTPTGTLSDVHVWVPRPTGYPRWFIAAADSSGVSSPILFLLVQRASGAPWQAPIVMLHGEGSLPAALAEIAVDQQGYATALPPDDPGLAATPASLPALYSRQFNSASGRGRFAPGLNTTVFHAHDQSVFAGAVRYGWRVTDVMRPSGQPVYALRTLTGAALVIFVDYDDFSWTALTAAAQLPSGNTPAVNQQFEPNPSLAKVLGVATVQAGLRLTIHALCQCIADDPPAQASPLQLLDYYGGDLGGSRS
jgi:hypothetical protein